MKNFVHKIKLYIAKKIYDNWSLANDYIICHYNSEKLLCDFFYKLRCVRTLQDLLDFIKLYDMYRSYNVYNYDEFISLNREDVKNIVYEHLDDGNIRWTPQEFHYEFMEICIGLKEKPDEACFNELCELIIRYNEAYYRMTHEIDEYAYRKMEERKSLV